MVHEWLDSGNTAKAVKFLTSGKKLIKGKTYQETESRTCQKPT